MLEFQGAKDNTLIRTGITCFLCSDKVKLPPEPVYKDYCFCKITGCDYENMYAFTGNNDYESDQFSLFSQVLIDHTVSYFAIKKSYSGDTEIPLVDGVHGTLNVFDDNTQQFMVNWKMLSDAEGHGVYDLKIVRDYAGTEREELYRTFMVTPFDQELADGTVRITTYINNVLENIGDFKDYNVKSQIRLKGRTTLESIQGEYETNPTGDRKQVQVHDREWNQYNVSIEGIIENTYDLVVKFYLMSDLIVVDDYNLFNKNFQDLYLRKNEAPEVENVSKFNTRLIIKAVDYDQDRVKRT